MSDIRQWLEELGLGQYAEAFEAEQIAFGQVTELTDTDLEKLGLPMGPRKALLKAARELRHGPDDVSMATEPAALASGGDVALQDAAPVSYTPRRLVERILTGRSSLEGERKQVTVLFADVAGYSRLIGEDEAGILAALKAHRREIDSRTSQYNGRTIWLRIMKACDDLLAKKRLEGAAVH